MLYYAAILGPGLMSSPFYQIFIGEKSFLGVGHLAVALRDDAVISKTDTDSCHTQAYVNQMVAQIT